MLAFIGRVGILLSRHFSGNIVDLYYCLPVVFKSDHVWRRTTSTRRVTVLAVSEKVEQCKDTFGVGAINSYQLESEGMVLSNYGGGGWNLGKQKRRRATTQIGGGNDKVGGIRWETREPPVKYGRSHGRVP